MARELGCGGSVSAYADDITIIMALTTLHKESISVIKNHGMAAGANINRKNSVDLQPSTRRGKSMFSDNVDGRCTEGSIKLLGV